MFKLLKKLVFLAVLVGILIVSKNWIAKFAVTKGVEQATGLKVDIGKFDLGLKNTQVGIENLNVLNPEGYPDDVMFDAPEIFVDYNLGSIVRGKLHLEEIRLDLKELVIVKNQQGALNINAIKTKSNGNRTGGKTQGGKEEKAAKEKNKSPDLQIDHMLLKIGKVVYKDYSAGDKPVVKEFKVDIYEKFDDIDSQDELLAVIVQKAITKTTLASIANLEIDLLKEAALKGTLESIKGKVGSFTEKFNLPFGGNE